MKREVTHTCLLGLSSGVKTLAKACSEIVMTSSITAPHQQRLLDDQNTLLTCLICPLQASQQNGHKPDHKQNGHKPDHQQSGHKQNGEKPEAAKQDVQVGSSIGMSQRNPLDLIKSDAPLLSEAKTSKRARTLAPLLDAAGRDETCVWYRVRLLAHSLSPLLSCRLLAF